MWPRSLTPTQAYIEWLTTTCNPRLRISIDTKPSDPDEEEQPEHEPEINNCQTPIHDDFWDQDIFSQLQDPQSQPHTTQNIYGFAMHEFLDTPIKISSNHHPIPPREMHMSPIISQLTNKIQSQTMVTITQTKQQQLLLL